ncbi:MAG: acyl-CoA dehydrogenase [Deltaproteobacteria bacterium]|nr:acyl-CoA dehydrogenase [Deltaproteobacteria bacterium]
MSLDPILAREKLGAVARLITRQPPASLWEIDTSLLPPALGAYRRKVRDFARRELLPRCLEADADPDRFDRIGLVRIAARAGILTDSLPRPLGTGGAWTLASSPLLAAHLRMEELCAACGGLGLLLGANELGMLPILLSADFSAIRRLLWPALQRTRRGEPSLFAFAITEPDAGSDVQDTRGARTARIVTRARRVPNGWRIRGRKCFITNGDIAERVSLFAALEDEGLESWTCFVVERAQGGFAVGRHERKLGQRAANAVELVLDDVFVPDDHVVGPLRGGWALARATLDMSRGPVGAIALGIARGAVEAALEVARSMRVGGRALVEHDDVALAFADMLMELGASRSLLWQTAGHLPPRAAAAATAKAFCAESAWRVCSRAMEVLGDAAIFSSSRVEKALRDARLNQIYEGTDEIQRLALLEAQWTTDIAGGTR